MMRNRKVALLGAAVVGLTVGLLLQFKIGGSGGGGPAPLIQGAVYEQPKPLPEFELNDAQGRPLTRDSFKGQWTLVYFGYTYCPDVCPTSLQTIASAERLLAGDGVDSGFSYLFVSVDPKRDTLARLTEYTAFFSDRLQGATGDHEQLLALSRPLGVIFAIVGDDPDDYLVDHSSSFLLINPKAELQAVLTAPHNAEKLAEDLRVVHDYYQD